MSISDIEFDGEAIASGIARWASMESPSYDTDAVNRMMDEAAAVMGELGAVITRYDGGTQFGDIVRAHFPWGEGPGILVLGHLDTVHDIGTIEGELAVSRDGDRLYGPGVLDMKGGMYIAIEALRHVLKMGVTPRRPMTFMFIPDEEIGSPFSRPFIETEARAHRYVLVPEPGKENFVTGRHSVLRYKLRTIGQPAHAGRPVGPGHSAIAVMAQLITQIEAYSDIDQETTYRVGKVHGGTFVNVVTPHCSAEVLCIAPTPEAFNDIQRRMGALISPDRNVRLVVEQGPIRPLFQANDASRDLLNVAQRVARDVGLELGEGQYGGGSDGNITGAMGIPTLDGLGVCGDGVHTKTEYLSVSSIVPRTRLLAGLYQALSERNL